MFTSLIVFDGIVWCLSVPQCKAYAAETGIMFPYFAKREKEGDVWLVMLKSGKLNAGNSKMCGSLLKKLIFFIASEVLMFGNYSGAH